ncbi:MAG: AzlD domain-containing protein [Pseudorhodoplanes sp.]
MTYDAIDAWWWPYLFILLAGWLATNIWRFIGVYVGGRIAEDSDLLVLVRTVATALVAGLIGNLIVFPSGSLAAAPLVLRIAAVACGFAAYIMARRNMLAGIAVGEVVLLAGLAVM